MMHVKKAANEFGTYYIVTSKDQDEIDEFVAHFSERPIGDDHNQFSNVEDEILDIKENLDKYYKTEKELFCVVINPIEKFHPSTAEELGFRVIVQKINEPIFKNLELLGPENTFLDFKICTSMSPLGEIEEYINDVNAEVK
jgi:hypothetical protein